MRKNLSQYFETIISLVCFIGVIISYSYKILDDKLFIGSMGTIATLYFGLLKFKIENDKIFRELFNSFNEKYDVRFNDLINELKSKPEKVLVQDDENLIIDYLNLCAEEYLWRSKNRIPKNVWLAWKSGIKENLKIPKVNEIFIKETSSDNGRKSYYGLVEELNK